MSADEESGDSDIEGGMEVAADLHERAAAHMQAERPFRYLLDEYRIELIDTMRWEAVLDYLLSDTRNGLHRGDQTERIRKANNDFESRRQLLDAVLSKSSNTFRVFLLGLARPAANSELAMRMAKDADEKLELAPPLLPDVQRMSDVGDIHRQGSGGAASVTSPVQVVPETNGSMSQAGMTFMPATGPYPVSLVGESVVSRGPAEYGSVTTVSTQESEESTDQQQLQQPRSSAQATPTYATDDPIRRSAPFPDADLPGLSLRSENFATMAVPMDETTPSKAEMAAGEAYRGAESLLYDGLQGPIQATGDVTGGDDGDGGGGGGGSSDGGASSGISLPPSPLSNAGRDNRAAAPGHVPWFAERGIPGAAMCALGLMCLLLVPADRAPHVVILTGLGVSCSLVYHFRP